jgi:hypothetical protein
MNIFRQLAWAAVLAVGLPASTVAPIVASGGAAPAPGSPVTDEASPQASPVPRPPAAAPVPVAGTWPGWPWPFAPEDDIEDEFEGEGWSFWGA